MGAGPARFFTTSGQGSLIRTESGSVDYPIGVNSGSFSPVVILNGNLNVEAGARVEQGVSHTPGGTGFFTDSVVDRSWFIGSLTGNPAATIQLHWNPTIELPGFDRNNCGIASPNGGFWVLQSIGNASPDAQGGYYQEFLGLGTKRFSCGQQQKYHDGGSRKGLIQAYWM